MQKFSYLLIVFSACVFTGCNTIKNFDRDNLVAYLNTFVGQPSSKLQSTLDLKQFGFDSQVQPKIINGQMIYTINRLITIPIPMPQYSAGVGSTNVSVPMNTATNSYQVSAKCYVIFEIVEDRVTNWSTRGRAC